MSSFRPPLPLLHHIAHYYRQASQRQHTLLFAITTHVTSTPLASSINAISTTAIFKSFHANSNPTAEVSVVQSPSRPTSNTNQRPIARPIPFTNSTSSPAPSRNTSGNNQQLLNEQLLPELNQLLNTPSSNSIPSPPAPNLPTGTVPFNVTDPFLAIKKDQLEIKDPVLIFQSVWNALLNKVGGEENMSFPKDIMWLAGAPGAGKGAMTPMIAEYRGITTRPIEVGALLTSSEALRMKKQGKLVGDRQVIELLFEALLRPEYQSGVLVDGFPRTREQAECIKLLYDQMQLLRRKYADTPHYHKFRRPIFHITVLYIDKEESVRRQLRRGKLAQIHNEVVSSTGIGELKPVRETDLDPTLAEERYRLFKNQVYESLKLVKERFHFHFINAEGSPQEVQDRILKELKYQSSMELGDDTFEKIRGIPLASEIIVHARHELVKRLDHYRAKMSNSFDAVIGVLQTEFVHILRRQALSGKAIIRSANKIFQTEPLAIDMALDLLTERGYTVVLDVSKEKVPVRFNLQTGEILFSQEKIHEFQIEFPRPAIRRG